MKAQFAVVSIALVGCFHPRYSNGSLTCAHTSECPPGYHCAANFSCYQNGSDPRPIIESTDGGTASIAPDMTDLPAPPQEARDMTPTCIGEPVAREHSTPTCVEGQWGFVCDSGFKRCGNGTCVGADGCCTSEECAAAPDRIGVAVCHTGVCTINCGELTLCGPACVNLMSDRANCGSCGHACLETQCFLGNCELQIQPIY